MRYIIHIKGLNKLQKRLKNAEKVKQELAKAMETSTTMLKYEARNTVSVDTGALRRSIGNQVTLRGNSVIGRVGAGERYGTYVEYGTHPHYVSAKALERWARKRGLNPYAVARSIARKGTQKHPFLIPSFVKLRSQIEAIFQKVFNSI